MYVYRLHITCFSARLDTVSSLPFSYRLGVALIGFLPGLILGFLLVSYFAKVFKINNFFLVTSVSFSRRVKLHTFKGLLNQRKV